MNKLQHAAAPARARVQRQQVADAAARGLATAIRKGGGEVMLRLRPEGLGRVTISMKVQDAKVEASLRAQTETARELLTESLPHLKAALEAQGLSVETIVVEPGGAPAGMLASAQDAQHERRDAQAGTPGGSGQSPHSDHDGSQRRSAPATTTPGGDWAGHGTDAGEDAEPLWAVTPGAMTGAAGALEWIA
jgi:flagellar hook-length control protein FliK